MANKEHLVILNRGVGVWNQWRKHNPEIRPDLARTDLSGAKLNGIDFHGAVLFKAILIKADLRKTDLSEAVINNAVLSGASLNSAILNEADLSGAVLDNTDLHAAVLIKVDLRSANLSGAVLYDANLRGGVLHRTNLTGANLSGADLTNARIGWTVFSDVNLSNVKGLETIKHGGPSSIGIDTIYRSKGHIPHKFLLDAGVPKDTIDYLLPLAGKTIDFYSCFISYSSQDQAFVERLHADLQAKGIRTWFAPEDLKTGDKFRHTIDQSIRIHDKLLLVLSKSSIKSDWVESEVETALDEERKRHQLGHANATILFPIRIDNTVLKNENAWVNNIKLLRHIGDFALWKTNHAAYQIALNKLLHDLAKSETVTEKL